MSTNIGKVGTFIMVAQSYEDSAITDAIEQSIAATLPEIAGLDSSLSPAERWSVLGAAADRSRSAFIALHGSAFGCELPIPVPFATKIDASVPMVLPQFSLVATA